MTRVNWARRSMPLSAAAASGLSARGEHHIGVALPLDPATANLALWLIEAGFKVSVLADGRGSDRDELLTALRDAGAVICADDEAFLDCQCDIVLDRKGDHLPRAITGAVLTSSHLADGVSAIRARVIHLGASPLIELCVSTHGIGQTSVSGFLDITNLQIAGSHVLVIGYGAIGQGVAKYARGYGARVMVCESDPVKAVQASLDGHDVAPIDAALTKAAAVFHADADAEGLSMAQIETLPDGAFLCCASDHPNAFPRDKLEAQMPGKVIRDHVTQYDLEGAKSVKLVCDGHPIHKRAGGGLPLEYADVQVAAQLYAIGEITSPNCVLSPGLNALPASIETALAKAFLDKL